MADDDIERILREVAATSQPGTAPSGQVAPTASAEVARADGGGGRLAFAVIAAVGLGAATWFVGLVLPFVSAVSAGIGGALAAFVVAVVAGPPRWFSS